MQVAEGDLMELLPPEAPEGYAGGDFGGDGLVGSPAFAAPASPPDGTPPPPPPPPRPQGTQFQADTVNEPLSLMC